MIKVLRATASPASKGAKTEGRCRMSGLQFKAKSEGREEALDYGSLDS